MHPLSHCQRLRDRVFVNYQLGKNPGLVKSRYALYFWPMYPSLLTLFGSPVDRIGIPPPRLLPYSAPFNQMTA